MCGIIGLVSEFSVFPKIISSLKEIKHRGPDGFGIGINKQTIYPNKIEKIENEIIKGNNGIGQTHLKITGKGKQPFISNDGKIILAHNGEIYNFEVIKKELNEKEFVGTTDSEIFIHFISKRIEKKSIKEIVKEIFEKFDGNYAIAFTYKNKLYAFRDSFGIRPLWYSENINSVCISSEKNAISKIGFKNSKILPPGKLLEANGRKTIIHNIAKLKNWCENSNYKNTWKNSLIKSVQKRTKNQKKIGVYFSGGLDSSVIAKIASEFSNVKLLTVGTNESLDILSSEESANELGLTLYKKIIKEKEIIKLTNNLKEKYFSNKLDLMIGTSQVFASKLAKEKKLKVCLSGQGADEVFGGYNNYLRVLKEGNYNILQKELWNSLSNTWEKNLIRDDLTSMINSIELRVPYLDRNFVNKAMQIKPQEKILNFNDKIRKHPLRKFASELKISKTISEKPKKAIQYSSGIGKKIKKIMNNHNKPIF